MPDADDKEEVLAAARDLILAVGGNGSVDAHEHAGLAHDAGEREIERFWLAVADRVDALMQSGEMNGPDYQRRTWLCPTTREGDIALLTTDPTVSARAFTAFEQKGIATFTFKTHDEEETVSGQVTDFEEGTPTRFVVRAAEDS